MNEGSSKVVGEGAPSESSATLIHEKVSLCLLQQAWLQRTPGLCTAGAVQHGRMASVSLGGAQTMTGSAFVP